MIKDVIIHRPVREYGRFAEPTSGPRSAGEDVVGCQRNSRPLKSTRMATAIGIDVGTTNSSIAHANDTGKVAFAHFPYMGEVTAAYRSLPYL